jgi:hypothetical protein
MGALAEQLRRNLERERREMAQELDQNPAADQKRWRKDLRRMEALAKSVEAEEHRQPAEGGIRGS